MLKILSIDDSRSVHSYLRSCFSGKDVELTSASNGSEGLEVGLAKGKYFDLILLDWEMPSKNGIDVLTGLRENGIEVPVIMMTTKNSPENIREALESGATEYIMKPFTPDILFSKIEQLIGRRE